VAQSSWYRRWFGEEYLQMYAHRDEREARRAVDLVLDHAKTSAGARALDVACGSGRHLRHLRDRGIAATGLDLSLPLVARACARGFPVVRGDMRCLPFRSDYFDLATNFFTSFGYFLTAEEDARVLGEIRRVLRPRGAFALDFLNAERVRAELPATDERVVRGRRLVQTRALAEDGRIVEKRIEIHDPADRLPHTFYERVRLYSADELDSLLDEHDLVTHYRFGDYDASPLAGDSPRAIFVGRCR
jgi:SAM-dependent methyltransferase